MNPITPCAQRKTALITGASRGIGRALTDLFARDGYDLVLVAQDRHALEALAQELRARAHVTVTVIATDLSRPTASEDLITELQRAAITIDVLVNNAGFGVHGACVETDWSRELAMMQVNMVVVTHLTKRFARQMVERGHGKILNVASTAAFQPGPLMAVYYASKAYVLSFSEALANELQGSGVTLTVLCPGPTDTNFQLRAGMTHTRLFRRGAMDAKTVAIAGYRGLMRGEVLVIPGFRNRLLAFGVRLVPRGYVTRISRWLQERRTSSRA